MFQSNIVRGLSVMGVASNINVDSIRTNALCKSQILLMLVPSVVTPQNQYFPANAERMSVHCLESGCIGKYTHLGPRDFPRVGILHPSALEIALGLRPRAISRASGCKIPALGKSLGPRGVYFPIHPSSRQCTDTIQSHANQCKSM